MTSYNDAEFSAISLLRLAADETDGQATRAAIATKVDELRQRHGPDGLHALIVALARFGANAAWVIAGARGTSAHDLLHEFAVHKVEQHAQERDNASSQ